MENKIPKIIHYIWVGGAEKSPLICQCIQSFEKFCPDYQIIEWNENNFDVENNPWVKKALKEKNWALASDAMRIQIMYEYGGIYLDTDMELIKPLDDFLKYDAFFAYENELWFGTCIFGAVPRHDVFKMLLKRYEGECEIKFHTNVFTVQALSYVLKYLYNVRLDGKTQILDSGVALFAKDYFTPQDYITAKLNLTDNSHGIHRYTSTWHSSGQKRGVKVALISRKFFGRHVFKIFEKRAQSSYMKTLKKEYDTILERELLEEDKMNDKKNNKNANNNVVNNIIEVKNLRKVYGGVVAVKDISFNVKCGSFFAFLGQNGAGKSTTINMICSILDKDGGQIFIDGQALDGKSREIKQKIGIVFQNSVLDGNLTVMENLVYRASLYEMTKLYTRQRIEFLTRLLDLSHLLKRKYRTLSGGEKRRIDIARALIHDPQILFLDEPTTGLDPKTRIMVWETIEKLHKEDNLTIFLTTHYMEEVVRADDVIIINKGEIVASGTPDELKNNYSSDSVRVIAAKSAEFDELLNEQNYNYDYRNNSYYVYVKNSAAALDFIQNNRSFIDDFEVKKGDMDDVFLTVTGQQDIEG